MSNTHRQLIAAISSERVLTFPSAAIQRIWERQLRPAKQALASPYGIRLANVDVRVDLGSPSHRRFSDILLDRGFNLPAGRAIRFLVSDEGWDSFPERSIDNPLMILVEISENLAGSWSVQSENPPYPLLIVDERRLPQCLADIALDFSFANSHYYSQIISGWCAQNGGAEQFFKEKANFAYSKKSISEDSLPYIPLSWVARNGGPFGSIGHLDSFVTAWDDFLTYLDTSSPISRQQTCHAICRYPNFGGQLSADRVLHAIEQLDKGGHVLFVERKSMRMRETPSYRDEAYAVYSSMIVRGGGGKPFGFFSGNSLPDSARRLVDKGAAYALRIFVGEN